MNAPTSNSDRDQLAFARHHAFIIGIDAYEKVSQLQTAVADAEQLASVLGAQQHFLIHPPLLNATGADIRNLLEHTLATEVGKDDRVFFYFAGHGIAADGDEGPAGYIVPADADPADVKTFIPMDDLQVALDGLPCRHLLLVLDCCFSGAFKWSSNYRDVTLIMPKKIYRERFDRFIEDPAWQVITSAAYDQKALDVLHGKATGERGHISSADRSHHSPFAQALFDGLSGNADARTDANGEGDGVITATELYAYIRDQVEPETIDEAEHLRQTPGFFPLKKHDKGEFIFLKPNHRLNLPPIPKHSPYKGLSSFDESDRDLFYGRDRAIKELRAKAANNKLLVVTGASGSGKSSVIKAGLLPMLRAEGCRILDVIRPGTHPLAELEKALKQADTSAHEHKGRSTTVESGAVLLIDQLEEVITRCEDPKERLEFDLRLRQLLDDERIRYLILTVRSDFEPQFSGGALQAEWKKGRYTVPPFSIEELKEVVLLPTIQEVLIFDPPELVDTIVAEVVQSPGALPLLSYTLGELYEAYRTSGRQDRALKKDDYERLGGVMGALRTKADAVYANLLPPAQDVMRKIMLRMVSVEGELAGKRVWMDDLIYSDAEVSIVKNVVEQLVEARLVVKGKDYIEPAHDALVRAWKMLHDWTFAVGKDKLILGTKLNTVASEFAHTGNRGLLWNNNPNLPVLLKEVKEPQQWFNAKEIVFVNTSYHRKINNRRWMIGITSLVMVALASAAGYSAQQNYKARDELQRSTSLRISSVANDIINSDHLDLPGGSERALQQALAASLLVDPLRKVGWIQSLLSGSPALPPAEIFSSTLIAEMSLDQNVQHVDLDFTVRALASSMDGQHVAVGGNDGNNGVVRLWNTTLGTVASLLEEPGASVYTVAYSPDGTQIAAGGRGNDLWLWNAPQEPAIHIKLPIFFIWSIAFSPDGEQIAVGGNDQQVTLFNLNELNSFDSSTNEQPRAKSIISANGIVNSLAFSGDGTLIVAGTNWGKHVWAVDGDTGEWIEVKHFGVPEESQEENRGPPNYSGAAINYDGSEIVTAGKEARGDKVGGVRLWDRATGYQLGQELKGLTNARTVAFSPDGSRIAAGGPGGKVVMWDASSGERLAESTSVRKLEVLTLTFSIDGSHIVSSGEDGILNVWETKIRATVISDDTCEPSAVSPDRSRMIKGGSGDVSLGQGGVLSLFADDNDTTKLSERIAGHLIGPGNDNKEPPPADRVNCVKYSNDGQTIVSSSTNETIQFWKADADTLRATGPSIPGTAFVFSQDDELVAVREPSQNDDNLMLVRVYETKSRTPIGFWHSIHDDWPAVVQRVQSISGLAAGREKLCSRLARNMTHEQWQEWVSPEIEYVVQCPTLPIPASK